MLRKEHSCPEGTGSGGAGGVFFVLARVVRLARTRNSPGNYRKAWRARPPRQRAEGIGATLPWPSFQPATPLATQPIARRSPASATSMRDCMTNIPAARRDGRESGQEYPEQRIHGVNVNPTVRHALDIKVNGRGPGMAGPGSSELGAVDLLSRQGVAAARRKRKARSGAEDRRQPRPQDRPPKPRYFPGRPRGRQKIGTLMASMPRSPVPYRAAAGGGSAWRPSGSGRQSASAPDWPSARRSGRTARIM